MSKSWRGESLGERRRVGGGICGGVARGKRKGEGAGGQEKALKLAGACAFSLQGHSQEQSIG